MYVTNTENYYSFSLFGRQFSQFLWVWIFHKENEHIDSKKEKIQICWPTGHKSCEQILNLTLFNVFTHTIFELIL